MKMVLFGRCSNAGWREVGGVFYMWRCEMYFLDREKEVLYLQNVVDVSIHDAPLNIIKVLYGKEPCSVCRSARLFLCVVRFVQKARPFE